MTARAPGPEDTHPALGSGSLRLGHTGPLRRGELSQRARDVCPLLRSREATWSSVNASRELFCWAVNPPAGLTIAKQRALCSTASHVTCATYLAASAVDGDLSDPQRESLLWSGTSPLVMALEASHHRTPRAVSAPRAAGQALLVALMLVAFIALAITRSGPQGGGSANASLTPEPTAATSAAVVASPSPSPSPTAEPSAQATPSSVASATAGPGASATPSPTPRTYKVRSGDTLAVIAAKFHTTVKAIVAANGIVDPRTIHPGQTLVIP